MTHDWLFRYRRVVLLATLLVTVYCQLYFWLCIPYTAFGFNWRPDHQMQVNMIAADSIAAPYLQAGDYIEAIDGRPVRRSSVYYPPVLSKTAYTLTVQRGEALFDVNVPFLAKPDSYAYQVRAASGVLALVSYAVGFFALRYTRRDNQQAIALGGLFLLISVAVSSWNGTLMGVPLTWLTSQPLLFLLLVGQVYSGFLPHYKPLGQRTRHVLRVLLYGAGGLAAIAVFEGLFLFPRDSSFQALTGISIYQLSALTQLLGGLSLFCILSTRRFFAQSLYLKQQLNILLFAVSLGFLPAALLSFLPLGIFGDALLPIPAAMLGLLIVPLGYLYVIFRRSYLNLDTYVGAIVPRLILLTIFVALYGFSAMSLETGDDNRITSTQLAILFFVVAGLLFPPLEQSLGIWIQGIFFGRITHAQEIQQQFSQRVAHSPDIATFQDIIERVCNQFGIPRASLALRDGYHQLTSFVHLNSDRWDMPLENELLPASTLLRQSAQHPLFETLPWAEMLLPLHARDQTLGVLAVARPADGYFNQPIVAFLETTTATLAMGSEFITLLNLADKLSGKIIRVQQEEQHHFASLLHDDPIQRLFAIRSSVRDFIRHVPDQTPRSTAFLQEMAQNLTDLEKRLRHIYEQSSPSMFQDSIAVTIERALNEFMREHSLSVHRQIEDLEVAESCCSEILSRAVYHVLRGSLSNVIKHSDATAIHVTATCQENSFHLTINDNGSLANLPSESDLLRDKHFGIGGMKAWAMRVGGSLHWDHTPSTGTTFRLLVPLNT